MNYDVLFLLLGIILLFVIGFAVGRTSADKPKATPYDCYWSKRALAAEKLLRRVKDGPEYCKIGTDLFNTIEAHLKTADEETGVPK